MKLDMTREEIGIIVQLLSKAHVQLDQAQTLMDLRDKLQKCLSEG